jgi:hypothetical protein
MIVSSHCTPPRLAGASPVRESPLPALAGISDIPARSTSARIRDPPQHIKRGSWSDSVRTTELHASSLHARTCRLRHQRGGVLRPRHKYPKIRNDPRPIAGEAAIKRQRAQFDATHQTPSPPSSRMAPPNELEIGGGNPLKRDGSRRKTLHQWRTS